MFDIVESAMRVDDLVAEELLLLSNSGKSFCCSGEKSCFVGIGVGGICSVGSLFSSVVVGTQSGSKVSFGRGILMFSGGCNVVDWSS